MPKRTTSTERNALIVWENAYGTKGRCSSFCWRATGRYASMGCQCICGGMNHAKGKLEAIRNTRAFAHSWIARKRTLCIGMWRKV